MVSENHLYHLRIYLIPNKYTEDTFFTKNFFQYHVKTEIPIFLITEAY